MSRIEMIEQLADWYIEQCDYDPSAKASLVWILTHFSTQLLG